MKRNILVVILFLIGIFVSAQGRRANQSGIHAQYGYIPTNDTLKKGSFMAIAGYNHIFGDKGLLGKIEAFIRIPKYVILTIKYYHIKNTD
jgi:hypothetical protein